MADYKIFSADSHVSEPGDLWLQRLDEKYRFRAPRLEQRERNGRMQDFFCYEGFAPHPVAIGLGAAARGDAATFRAEGKGYDDALAGGWDPAARLEDQDVDGVDGEILYTTLGFRLFWLQDGGLQRACFRVYNDWLAEFCSPSPDRLVGLALMSLSDIEEARLELRRVAKQGHCGAMIWLSPPEGAPPYSSTEYDPFWAEAQELGMPLVLHENTGGAESRLSPSSYWDENISLGTIVRPHEVQRTLGMLILSGVMERFPQLKFISAENGTDWLPWFVGRVKMSAARAGSYPTKLSLAPIDYLRRQVYFTYIDEPHAVRDRDVIGADRLMFSTDYPHSASTWPRSREIVERDMQGVPDDERERIVRTNALEVFNVRTPALTQG